MKNIPLIMSLSLAISSIHGASHDEEVSSKLCDTFQKIIEARSLDTFKAQQSHIKQLPNDHIHELITYCNAYTNALEIIYEIRHDHSIRRELRTIEDTYREGNAYLETAQYLLPKRARSQAIAILHKTHKKYVGIALHNLSEEYTRPINTKELNTKISYEKECLQYITTLLQQELDTRTIAHNP